MSTIWDEGSIKRLILATFTLTSLWNDIVYLHDLIVNEGKLAYKDDYRTTITQYDLGGGRKLDSPNNSKYLKLYYELEGVEVDGN